MFVNIWRYLDEGAAGGGGSDKDASGGGDSSGGGGAAGGGGSDEGGSGGDKDAGGGGSDESGKKGAADDKGSGGKKPDAKELQTQLEAKTAEVEKLTGEFKTVKDKLDKNANLVGETRKLIDGKLSKASITNFAKKYGIQIGDDKGDDSALKFDLTKVGEDDLAKPDVMAKLFQANNLMVMKAITDQFGPTFELLQENQIAAGHDDWDSLKPDREVALLSMKTGKLHPSEAAHHVARSMNMAAAIAAAKELGKNEYIADLEKKTKGSASRAGGGAGATEKDKGEKETRSMMDEEQGPAILARLKQSRQG